MGKNPAGLEKGALLERLARGQGAGMTVVTPNRRLAQALRAEFDRFQMARGLRAWETADILPFEALVQRLWLDALYSTAGTNVPVQLSASQEQALWEEAIHATRYAETLFSAAPAAAAAPPARANTNSAIPVRIDTLLK